jgi:signal transduction histidine kinase
VIVEKSEESSYKREIAEHVSAIRCVLAYANVGVVFLDNTVPLRETPGAVEQAILGSLGFFAYSIAIWIALKRRAVSVGAYEVLTAVFDVVFAGFLVAATDGYLSPFNLWFVFAVVATGFTSRRWLPLLTTALALVIQIAVSIIPQGEPLDFGVFAVRTLYLFGFTATVASVGAFLTRHSETMRIIEEFGARIAEPQNYRTAETALYAALRETLRCEGIRISVEGSASVVFGQPKGLPIHSVTFRCDRPQLGRIDIFRHRSLGRDEIQTAGIIVDRFGSTVRRMQLTEKLIETASAEERLRLADRLHDGFIQTLSAVDLHAEVARELAMSTPIQAVKELDTIKSLAREAAAEARTFLLPYEEETPAGSESILDALRSRWKDAVEARIPTDLVLNNDQWRAVEQFVREGSNNAIRHGCATKAKFEVSVEGDQVHCSLEANGDPPSVPIRYGYGLSRLTSVFDGLGGSLSLKEGPQAGSVLSCRFPKVALL